MDQMLKVLRCHLIKRAHPEFFRRQDENIRDPASIESRKPAFQALYMLRPLRRMAFEGCCRRGFVIPLYNISNILWQISVKMQIKYKLLRMICNFRE